jgi:hypothetical protein
MSGAPSAVERFTTHQVRRAVVRAEAGKTLSVQEAAALMAARGEELERLEGRRPTLEEVYLALVDEDMQE